MSRTIAVAHVVATAMICAMILEVLGVGRTYTSPLLVGWFGGYFLVVAVVLDAVVAFIKWREKCGTE